MPENTVTSIIRKMNDNLQYMKIPHVNTTMLRVLVSLAETRSFSRTAEGLCITQSAVSHAIRGLEEAVGAQLVIRARSGLELTSAGHKALGSASEALSALQALLCAGQQALVGTVRLAAVVSASTAIVPAALSLARRHHPGLNVMLLVGTDAEVTRWVESGIADIGLAYDIGGSGCAPLIEDRLYAIGAVRSPFGRESAPACPSDFDGADFVMSAAGCAPMLESLFDRWNVKPNIVTKVSDMSALFAIVGAGHGVSIVPGLAFPSDWQERVTRRHLHPIERRSLRMTLCKSNIDQSVSGFMSLLKESCRAETNGRHV
ncbi:LysR family transcriptional regulator [Agrobacterium sp. SORGH_AS 787]|uniref:LysR family transcriptional regulator n=1 Tax=Agrobacterium sp. SORGH_AS 787 TaxID=3041775 RepID=UPI0032B7D7A9